MLRMRRLLMVWILALCALFMNFTDTMYAFFVLSPLLAKGDLLCHLTSQWQEPEGGNHFSSGVFDFFHKKQLV